MSFENESSDLTAPRKNLPEVDKVLQRDLPINPEAQSIPYLKA